MGRHYILVQKQENVVVYSSSLELVCQAESGSSLEAWLSKQLQEHPPRAIPVARLKYKSAECSQIRAYIPYLEDGC